MAHKIMFADPKGMGALHGLKSGETILTINGEDVIDEIDYQALSSTGKLCIRVQDEEGNIREVNIRK